MPKVRCLYCDSHWTTDNPNLVIGARSNALMRVQIQPAKLALRVEGTANTPRLVQRQLQNGPRLRGTGKRMARIRRGSRKLRILEGEAVRESRIRWNPPYSRGRCGMSSMSCSSYTFRRKCRFYTHQPSGIGCAKLHTLEILRLHLRSCKMRKSCCSGF